MWGKKLRTRKDQSEGMTKDEAERGIGERIWKIYGVETNFTNNYKDTK